MLNILLSFQKIKTTATSEFVSGFLFSHLIIVESSSCCAASTDFSLSLLPFVPEPMQEYDTNNQNLTLRLVLS